MLWLTVSLLCQYIMNVFNQFCAIIQCIMYRLYSNAEFQMIMYEIRSKQASNAWSTLDQRQCLHGYCTHLEV